jgi:hypothetical protein
MFNNITISPQKGAVFQIFWHKTPIKEETAKKKKNAFSKTFLEFIFSSKTEWRILVFEKKFKITVSYSIVMQRLWKVWYLPVQVLF